MHLHTLKQRHDFPFLETGVIVSVSARVSVVDKAEMGRDTLAPWVGLRSYWAAAERAKLCARGGAGPGGGGWVGVVVAWAWPTCADADTGPFLLRFGSVGHAAEMRRSAATSELSIVLLRPTFRFCIPLPHKEHAYQKFLFSTFSIFLTHIIHFSKKVFFPPSPTKHSQPPPAGNFALTRASQSVLTTFRLVYHTPHHLSCLV